MVGAHGTVIEWDGTKMVTWPKLGPDLANVWGTSRGDIWASGGGLLYHFDGAAWLALPRFEASSGAGAMWTNDPDRLFVLGTSGTDDVIYDYRPSTGRWTKTKVQGNDVIWGSGPNDLWTSGYPGDGMHFDGTTWSYYRTDDLYDIWGTGGGDVWGVGFLGGIAHHGPGNGAWMQTAQNLRMTHNDLYGLHGFDAANVWAVGQYGTIVRRRR